MGAPGLSILVHDFSGHAFTVQLARALAARGAKVTHASFAEFGSPKGRLSATEADPPGFRVRQVGIGEAFDKDDLVRRYWQQRRYAKLVAELIGRERPEVVLSGNAPIEVQEAMRAATQAQGGRFVFWLQDVHSLAIGRILGRRSRVLGAVAGAAYRRAERRTLGLSDGVVAISEDFAALVTGPGWGVARERVAVVENWAPLEPMAPRDNDWARANFRPGRRRIVYAGTLARKHDPEVLVRLAQGLDADVYLFSAGSGAERVRARAAALGLGNLFVRPWVAAGELPMMLAGADVLCAFIEADAGVFSVPSKVLAYLAAGRPILAGIPEENLAARTIRAAGAGLVSEPGDEAAMLANAGRLLGDSTPREEMGRSGRAWAEAAFDIGRIAERFERVLGLGVRQPAPVA